jgi:caa(3)-type oxidase subunit IV
MPTMTANPPSGRLLVATFVGLIALAVISWVAASLGTGAGLAMTIAAAKALAIALVFMELAGAHAVDRVIAVFAVFFVLLLCAGVLGDVAFR